MSLEFQLRFQNDKNAVRLFPLNNALPTQIVEFHRTLSDQVIGKLVGPDGMCHGCVVSNCPVRQDKARVNNLGQLMGTEAPIPAKKGRVFNRETCILPGKVITLTTNSLASEVIHFEKTK